MAKTNITEKPSKIEENYVESKPVGITAFKQAAPDAPPESPFRKK
jgi:hypothetical protein